MTTRAVEQVDDWDSHPFSGGYRGLHDLADEDFSGIVAAGPTRLCMTAGRVIGVLDGTVEDFEDADGTAYEAPSPSLPLLAVMQERTDEVRGKYYTEETPIEEVDRTLTQGNFTGFVELAENVLSGDYYLVYHQGRSMSVAWVGASKTLLTDDEAFEQANDEVGIYEVRPVDIEVIEIPEPAAAGVEETDESEAAAAAAPEADAERETADTASADEESAAGEATTESDAEPSTDDGKTDEQDSKVDAAEDDAEPDRAEAATGTAAASESEPEPPDSRDGEDGGDGDGAAAGAASAREDFTTETERSSRREDQGAPGGGSQSETGTQESQTSEHRRGQPEGEAGSRHEGGRSGQQRAGTGDRAAREGQSDATAGATGTAGTQSGTAAHGRGRGRRESGSGSIGDVETRSIPSLDPDRTTESTNDRGGRQGSAGGVTPTGGTDARAGPEPVGTAGNESRRGAGGQPSGSAAGQGTPQRDPRGPTAERSPAESQQGDQRREPAESDPAVDESGADPDAVAELEAELEDRESEIEDLEAELETVEGERADLERERDELREERDELRERVEQLERRIDELRTEDGGESVADRERLGPAEAIEGTNLFVRYRSKGDATLEAAHAGNAEAGAVNDNMQLQYHTQFEADDVAVNGEPFPAYLEATIQYNFVEWLVRVLPYEIRDTGHQEALGPLFDALPRIDRAELNGAVTVQYTEDGEEHRSQERFDVVIRDRMGNPLIVANMNESRQPASQSMMEGLISASQRVGDSKETLAGAFLVTSSFFEPEAMEAAADATGSGLLSRDKRESFVKLSRKDGFHLCLVEAREENFNLSVPEI